jgi:hypothetical protein
MTAPFISAFHMMHIIQKTLGSLVDLKNDAGLAPSHRLSISGPAGFRLYFTLEQQR